MDDDDLVILDSSLIAQSDHGEKNTKKKRIIHMLFRILYKE